MCVCPIVTFSLYFSVGCLTPRPLPHSTSGSPSSEHWQAGGRRVTHEFYRHIIRVARTQGSSRDTHHMRGSRCSLMTRMVISQEFLNTPSYPVTPCNMIYHNSGNTIVGGVMCVWCTHHCLNHVMSDDTLDPCKETRHKEYILTHGDCYCNGVPC